MLAYFNALYLVNKHTEFKLAIFANLKPVKVLDQGQRALLEVDRPQETREWLGEEHLAHLGVVLLKNFEVRISNERDLGFGPRDPEVWSKVPPRVSWVEHEEHVSDAVTVHELCGHLQVLHQVSDSLLHLLQWQRFLFDDTQSFQTMAVVLPERPNDWFKEHVAFQCGLV